MVTHAAVARNPIARPATAGRISFRVSGAKGVSSLQWRIRSRAAAPFLSAFLVAALSGCAAQNLNPVTGKALYAPLPAAPAAYYGQKASAKLAASYCLFKDAALA